MIRKPTSPLRAPLPLVALALVLPTGAAWVYFIWLDGQPSAPWVYSAAKVVQFSLPLLLFLRATGTDESGSRAPQPRALLAGALLGLLLATSVVVTYLTWILPSPLAQELSPQIAAKIQNFGVDSPGRFLLLALFLSLAHSGLEEYYWRWFAFGALTRYGMTSAVILSSLFFASHHALIVHQFAAEVNGWLVLPVTFGIAAGGALWAVLYRRTGRLTAPWLSHALADLAIMAIGYHLVWGQS